MNYAQLKREKLKNLFDASKIKLLVRSRKLVLRFKTTTTFK